MMYMMDHGCMSLNSSSQSISHSITYKATIFQKTRDRFWPEKWSYYVEDKNV